MPSKRPRSSSTFPSDDGSPSERVRGCATSPDSTRESSVDRPVLTVHVISAKLDPSVLDDLICLVEKHHGTQRLGLAPDPDHADVIVTAVHTRPRLERHIRWEVAKTKAIVTPGWLRDSVSSGTIQPCGRYAALGDLAGETPRPCPQIGTGGPVPSEAVPDHHGQRPVPAALGGDPKDIDLATLDFLSPFSCRRSSPPTCPNQALIEELDVIRRARLYEGEERSMLSYARAIASIKAYPRPFNDQTSSEDIAKLPYLGTKLTAMVQEFIQVGQISDAQIFLSSTKFLALSAFNAVHGIGPHTARRLYSLGLRTVDDLEKYYEVTLGRIPGVDVRSRLRESHSKELGVEKSIQVSLALRYDFSQKIPRQEVEEINQVIMRELEPIEAGCKSIVVGGSVPRTYKAVYRRGKLESNDVDILISHADWDHGADKVRGLCKKLVQRLHERGLVKHVLNMSGHHPHNVFRTHHWDSLEKALTVFVLTEGSARKPIHRRVDLVFTFPNVFWTAVVGWTGSTMFERDLRLWAKREKGLKFDSSGITRRHDSKPFFPRTEHEVFDLLGLAYVPPDLRNADA